MHIVLLIEKWLQSYKHFSDQLKKGLFLKNNNSRNDSVHPLLCLFRIRQLIVYLSNGVCVCLLHNVVIQTKAKWVFKASVNIKRIIFKVSLLIRSGSVLKAPPPVKPLTLHL